MGSLPWTSFFPPSARSHRCVTNTKHIAECACQVHTVGYFSMSGSQRCAPPLTLSMRPRLFDGQDRSPLRPHSCKMAEARCGQQTADGGQRRCWNATDGMREEGGSRFTVIHLNRRWCTAKANTSDLLPRGNVSLKNSSRQRAGFCSIHLKKKKSD